MHLSFGIELYRMEEYGEVLGVHVGCWALCDASVGNIDWYDINSQRLLLLTLKTTCSLLARSRPRLGQFFVCTFTYLLPVFRKYANRGLSLVTMAAFGGSTTVAKAPPPFRLSPLRPSSFLCFHIQYLSFIAPRTWVWPYWPLS
jgi:vesicle coat complex subunit